MSYDPRRAGALCDTCPLNEKVVVPPEGPDDPEIAVVGEAPGYREIEQLRPFVGPSGQLLNALLSHQNVPRERVWITNSILCSAPELRVGSEVQTDTKTMKKAIECCRPRLLRELSLRKKTLRAVTPLGATAVRSLTNRKSLSILAARGFVWSLPDIVNGAAVIPSVHPAFVLRAPAWMDVLVSDFDRVVRASQGLLRLPQPKMSLAPSLSLLEGLLDRLGDVVAVDVETTRLGATTCALLCIGISDGHRAVVIPWASTQSPSRRFYESKQGVVSVILKRALAKRTIVTHNGPGFDHVVLARYGIELAKGAWEDTLLAHHAFASHFPQRLDHVVSMYLDAPPWKILSRKPAKSDERGAWDPGKLKDDELWTYNAEDCVFSARTWHAMKSNLQSERKVYEADKRLAMLCRGMQERGVAVDLKRREEVRRELLGRQNYYLGALRKLAGFEVVPTKLDHLRKVLFKILHAPVLFRSLKTGLASTGVDTLQALAQIVGTDGTPSGGARFSRLLLKWREAWKLRSTYVDGITPERDGRVHPSWRAWGTVTGRFSVREPNLANLKRGSIIRSMYVAPKGRTLVGFDVKALEMRVAAYLSDDKALISACESGDVHLANALALFGELPPKYLSVEDEKADKQNPAYKRLRTMAKSAGFAMNYGAAAETVHARLAAQGLGVSLQQVEAMLQRLRRTYKHYFSWQEENLRLVQKQGFMRSWGGRSRWFGHEPMPTELKNYPIQAGAADYMNLILPEIEDVLPLGSFIVAQIHDAAIIECAPRQADRIEKLCSRIAERPLDIGATTKVVFPIDIKRGGRWSDVA